MDYEYYWEGGEESDAQILMAVRLEQVCNLLRSRLEISFEHQWRVF